MLYSFDLRHVCTVDGITDKTNEALVIYIPTCM